MKIRYIFFSLFLSLGLILLGSCKKNCPTDPNCDILTLSGTITLSGQAYINVDVYLSLGSSQKKITGADGKFTFSNLVSDTYIITPSKEGITFNPSNYEITGESREDLNFTAANATYGTEVNDIAVDFTAKNQKGKNISLSDYHGKVVLLDFTADWCGPCRQKAETAEEFYQKYKYDGFEYILVVIEGDPKVWAETYGLSFNVLDDNNQSIYNQYRKTDIPLPHVLDRNLTIMYKKVGWNKDEVQDRISKYL